MKQKSSTNHDPNYKPWSKMGMVEKAEKRQRFMVMCPMCGYKATGKSLVRIVRCGRCGYVNQAKD